MDHDEMLRSRLKVLTTSMSTPEVQMLRAMHRRTAPKSGEDDARARVEWLTQEEATARVAAGARMLCGGDRGSPSFDPCRHSWRDFVGSL
jgi:hypothetical protein